MVHEDGAPALATAGETTVGLWEKGELEGLEVGPRCGRTLLLLKSVARDPYCLG